MSVEVIDGQLHVTGNVTVGGKVTCAGATVAGDMDVEGAFSAQVGVTPFKGLFASVESLKEAYTKGAAGDYAYVGDALPARLYRWNGTEWRDTGNYGGDGGEIDLADYWRKTDGKVIAAIDISGGFAVLDTYNLLSGSAGIYRLTSSGGSYTYGYMMVMCDVAMRSVQQWVFGKFAVTGGTLAIAQQELHSVCVRSCLYPEAGGQGQAGWTTWSYLAGDPAGGIDALKASVENLQARTLGGGAIDISAGFAVLDTYNAFARCGIYRLKLNDVVASGYLLVTSDNMGHTIDQWLVGNYVIGTDGSVSGSHNDGMYSVCCRSYGLFSSVVPAGQWTAWTYAVKADPLRPSAASYPAVVKWSGETIHPDTIAPASLMSEVLPSNVYYDAVRNTFVARGSDGSWHTNWMGREAYQSMQWSQQQQDAGTWNPGYVPALFAGINGASFVAVSPSDVIWLSHSNTKTSTDIAGIFAGTADDVVSGAAGEGAGWWFIKALGCFGYGTVSESAADYVGAGYKRFTFTGKTAFTSAETPAGFTYLQSAVLPVDGGIYAIEGRGMEWEMRTLGGEDYPYAVATPLFRLDVGDCLLDDGTFMFREQAVMDYSSRVVGIIIDPVKRIMLPVPTTVILSAFAGTSQGVLAVVNAIKDQLSCITSCIDYDTALSGLWSALDGSDASFDSYFPAFYSARYTERNGYKRFLATKAECTLMGADWRIREVADAVSGVPQVFYGVTPRYTVGDLSAVAQLVLEGDEAKGNATVAATSGGGFATLALYNE